MVYSSSWHERKPCLRDYKEYQAVPNTKGVPQVSASSDDRAPAFRDCAIETDGESDWESSSASSAKPTVNKKLFQGVGRKKVPQKSLLAAMFAEARNSPSPSTSEKIESCAAPGRHSRNEWPDDFNGSLSSSNESSKVINGAPRSIPWPIANSKESTQPKDRPSPRTTPECFLDRELSESLRWNMLLEQQPREFC